MSKRAKTTHTATEQPKESRQFYTSERFWTVALTVLFLIAAIATAVTLRLATVDLSLTDRWAQSSVDQQGVNQFAAQIRQQFPTLPEANVQQQAQKQWAQYKEQNKADIEQQQKFLSEQLRAFFQYEAGSTKHYNQTYVLEMDPYLWWHQAVNYADHGDVCDVGSEHFADGSCRDAHRLAPTGTHERPSLHVVLEAWMIKAVRMFNSNLDTLTIVFFLPVILASLAIIPAFFIGRKLAGNMGGFIAAMIMAVHPVLMNRTIAGFSDTDGYVFLLALFAVWFLLEAMDTRKWWTRILFTSLAGLSIGLYAFAWTGWWFTFFVLVVALLAVMLYTVAVHFKHKENRRAYKDLLPMLAIFGVFIITAGIFTTVLTDFSIFTGAFTNPFTVSANLQAATSGGDITGWPNILTTVAELNIPSLSTIVANLGGTMLVVFAAFGLFALLIDPRNLDWKRGAFAIGAFLYYLLLITKGMGLDPIVFLFLFALPLVVIVLYNFIADVHVQHLAASIIMMAWLLAVLFATTKGIRFLLMGIPPFAIGFGIAIGWIFAAIVYSIVDTSRDFKRIALANLAVGLVLLLIIFNPVAAYSPLKSGKYAADNQVPGMNDAWWGTLKVVREQTPQNTIITSWWDFGHWFRNIGNRSVTFDGGSQNPEPGHIVGKILLSSDEHESVGLLRMLDCGQNKAYEIAHKSLDVVPARDLIEELVLMDRAAASERLTRTGIPPEDQTSILNYTHCEPPPAVFITSGDMVGKAGVWGHFGSWDFRRAMVYHYSRNLPQREAISAIEKLNYTAAQANELYFNARALKSESQANTWIAGWPSYISGWQDCSVDNNTAVCGVYAGISQTPQGVLAIETVQFNTTAPLKANISYGMYSNSARLGGKVSVPARVALADFSKDNITSSSNEGSDLAIGLLIRKDHDKYSILIADPLQVDSLFTQLYYLDGHFNEHFTKLTETQELGGSKIIVWNVTWPND